MRLGVPSVKAHRSIARANRLGFIRVSIDAPVAAYVRLENELQRKFGLEQCIVAPELDDGPMPLRSLGLSGGRLLGFGVVLHRATSRNAEAMARCLADVAARIPEEASIRALTGVEEDALMNWEAEAYRQSIGR